MLILGAILFQVYPASSILLLSCSRNRIYYYYAHLVAFFPGQPG